MDVTEFARMQSELIWAFWPLARLWLILFFVGGVLLAPVLFFFVFMSEWLENR